MLLLDYATQIDRKLLDEVGRTQQLLAERDQAVEKAIKEKSASDAEKEVLVAKLRAAEADNGESRITSHTQGGQLIRRIVQRED